MINSEKKIIYDCVKNALNNAENNEEVFTTLKLTQKASGLINKAVFWALRNVLCATKNIHLVALSLIIALIAESLWNKEAFLRFFIFVYGSIVFEPLYRTATKFVKRKTQFFLYFLFFLKLLDKQTPLCYTILVR